MPSRKRRKLNVVGESENATAFAARRRLRNDRGHPILSQDEISPEIMETKLESREEQLFGIGSPNRSKTAAQVFQLRLNEKLNGGTPEILTDTGNFSDIPKKDDNGPLAVITDESRENGASDSEQLLVPFTTIDLTKDHERWLSNGDCIIKIGAGERLVVLGEYGLSVLAGHITILGATISVSGTVHDVFAPLSHSLPVIRYLASDKSKAEIRLHQKNHGLRSMSRLSPLFAGLWANRSSIAATELLGNQQSCREETIGSFHILSSINQSQYKGAYPIISPPEWNEVLHTSASKKSKAGKLSTIVICGPKSSGKSTFARLLVNRLVTGGNRIKKSAGHALAQANGVAFLDLDPGQPEYSPPGQLSLIHISIPQLGPQYSHPDNLWEGRKLIRAHSIAAVSPSADPNFYITCVTDLLSHYAELCSRAPCHLVINTPGWILGSGLELLVDIISVAKPSKILYLSQDGPREVVESLQTVAKSIPLVTLPSQPTERMTRKAAQLRTMQYMSYFHLDPTNTTEQTWSSSPLTSVPPWEVKYAGHGAGIIGIMCLGEQPPSTMLRETLDGRIVAVVVLDDLAAIPGYRNDQSTAKMHENSDTVINKSSDWHQNPSNLPVVTADVNSQIDTVLIVHTPEGIPYFNPANETCLDPRYSHTIGLALVRAIDNDRKVFQLITPIPATTIRSIRASGKAIVLLSGKLDTPWWAYLEPFYKESGNVRTLYKRTELGSSDIDSEASEVEEGFDWEVEDQKRVDSGFKHAPWVEISHGDKGRGVGARVWRVRRDLGRIGEGT